MTEPSDKPDLSKKPPESEEPAAPQPGEYPPPAGGYQPPSAGYPQAPGAYYPPPQGYAPPGYPQPGFGGGYESPVPTKKNGLGIAALIVAIVALLLFWTVFGGILLGVVAVILGVIGMVRAKRGEADNRGVAIGGVVLGVLAVIASIAFIVLGFLFFWNMGFDNYYDCLNSAGNDRDEIQKCADQFESTIEDRFSTTFEMPAPTPTR
ncbi:MAG: DUF4190 domain-containing protein [Mycobacterium sp.]